MRLSIVRAVAVASFVLSSSLSFAAESISGAMAKAYQNNSTLNAARAGLRAVDENVPLAKSGYRPRVQSTLGITRTGTSNNTGSSTVSFGIEINQSIFDGFQTRNNVQAAEAGVRAERANLANTEQNTLFDTAQAFMNVVQSRQVAAFRAKNLEALQEQVRSEQSRFDVGEGTRTDVAQAQAGLAAARAQLASAQADIKSNEAIYQQLVGSAPGNLTPAKPLSKLVPKTASQAEQIAYDAHPAIIVRNALVDSGLFTVKSAEGAFLPQIGLSASLTQSAVSTDTASTSTTTGRVGVNVVVPIYQGGQASATVRKNKESLGQAQINVDVARDQVRAAVYSAFAQYEASQAGVVANRETLSAANLALNGVIEERNVGQRTTLDVLNARTTVLNSQIALAQAQSGLVVSSYAVVSAIGRLSAKRLGLGVQVQDPEEHYNAVKDRWFGLRTPDGR